MRRITLLLALTLLAAGCQKKAELSPAPDTDAATAPQAHEVSPGVVESDAPSAAETSKPKKPSH